MRDMLKTFSKIALGLCLSMFCIGIALADAPEKPKKSEKSARELVESGKKVGIQRIIKSADPELI